MIVALCAVVVVVGVYGRRFIDRFFITHGHNIGHVATIKVFGFGRKKGRTQDNVNDELRLLDR